jgi:uncharacterized protein (DUF1330 family)
MKVYVVNAYDINDFDTFSSYPPQVRPLLKKYGAKVLAMQTNPRTLEGTARTMNAIIAFPPEEAVDQFYHDPACQKIIGLRLRSTSHGSIVLLKEFRSE